MIHDLSQIRAIIKRDLFLNRDLFDKQLEVLTKNFKSNLSKSKIFETLFKYSLEQLKNLTIGYVIKKKPRSKRKSFSLFYLDLEQIFKNQSEDYYPDRIPISWRHFDSKNLDRHKAELTVCYIATHCIERVLRRSNAQNLKDSLLILNPTINVLIALAQIFIHVQERHKYILYWQQGYLVLEVKEHSFIILTWMPKDWFSNNQHLRFYNFQGDSFYLFDDATINSKGVLSLTDALLVIPPTCLWS